MKHFEWSCVVLRTAQKLRHERARASILEVKVRQLRARCLRMTAFFLARIHLLRWQGSRSEGSAVTCERCIGQLLLQGE